MFIDCVASSEVLQALVKGSGFSVFSNSVQCSFFSPWYSMYYIRLVADGFYWFYFVTNVFVLVVTVEVKYRISIIC